LKKLMVLALFFLVSCGQGHDTGIAQPGGNTERIPQVYTVNYPLAWMAQQLVADKAQVRFPAPGDVDPAFWQPDIAILLAYQQADLVLLNGAGYAKWIPKTSLPASRVLDTSVAYSDQLLAADTGPVHSHGPQGEHSHGELAFTTWLDLSLAQQQAQAVAEALQRLLPEDAVAIGQRLGTLQGALAGMDARLVALGEKLDGAPLLYSHPVYQYLQQRYQLNGQALHWEPDQAPDEAQWRQLADILQDHPAGLMLWEDQPLPQVTARLAGMGIKTVVFRLQGNRPRQGDFSSNLAADIAMLEALVN
jgi:zinc transport system substrate-binding protein